MSMNFPTSLFGRVIFFTSYFEESVRRLEKMTGRLPFLGVKARIVIVHVVKEPSFLARLPEKTKGGDKE